MSKMTIYEIDDAILSLINEDGEIADYEAFEALQMERDKKIENAACYLINLEADAKAIKEQEKVLADRRKALENRADGLRGYVEKALNGQKFSSPRVTVSYRKSAAVEVLDEAKFIEWAKLEHSDLITYKDPTINRMAVKAALAEGLVCPLAQVVERQNMQIR